MSTDTVAAPRLKARYREEIVPALREQFEYPNIMQVPGVVKVVVNMGVGDAARDAKLIEGAIRDLQAITGQKPAVTKARRSSTTTHRGTSDRLSSSERSSPSPRQSSSTTCPKTRGPHRTSPSRAFA